MKKAVFLDRDGVINQTYFRDGKARAPDHLHQFEFFAGVKDAVARLKQAGFLTIVVTNQPDVVRGWQKKEVVDAMNEKVIRELAVDDLLVCFHDDHENCLCRKPKPGMLTVSAEKWNIDLKQSFMVGDREGDIEAGLSAGCTSILISDSTQSGLKSVPAFQTQSLAQAADWILKQN